MDEEGSRGLCSKAKPRRQTMSQTAVSPVPHYAAPALRTDHGVGFWLLAIALLIALMVVVGGLTRLTGSGLSITEWRPVTGAIPPLSEADWAAEFAKYQGTTQYEQINRGMGLAGFKSIYWWEWGHRFLGRLIGFVFLFPFLYFVAKRRIDRPLIVRLGVIFALGAAQGALGWWMVESGLAGRVSVSHYRLAAHLGLAVILFGYVLWTALEVFGVKRTRSVQAARRKPLAIALAVLVFLQIILGAFVAGLDAGLAFSDWPTFGGFWIPPGLYDLQPWWLNHFDNHALAHFQHRNVGYLAALLAIFTYVSLRRAGADRPVRIAGIHVVLIVVLQVVLGIFAVVTMVALHVAALHQITALALFGAALWLVYTLTGHDTAASAR
jgi:cytochrome c oxidase assembly protein subunit 15